MSTADLKGKIRRLVNEIYNKHNLPIVDEIYAANVVYHHPIRPQKDRESLKSILGTVFTNLPDFHCTILDLMAAEGDKVVMRWTYEATDAGGVVAFDIPPTGKHVRNTMITIYRFKGGNVVDEWVEGNYLGMQQQLQGQV